MKHRINLYQASFQPRLDLLSLSSVAAAIGGLLAVMLVTWAIMTAVASSTEEELAALTAENQHLQNDVNAMQAVLAEREPDPVLTAKVNALKNTLSKQDRLLEELASREVIRNTGFAQLMTDLAAQSRADIWLQSVAVSESMMLLQGQVSQPEAMPQWLTRLAQTPSFSGRTFDSASVMREEDALLFTLEAQRQEEDEQSQGGRP
ncbi:hypothetical protein [Alteromonas antoniana]|uniref:hypothetical protein n=1 Tax=Alteromonas antoniana TaxID=2803813 RepID=UPI001C4437B6|nr:hypothetical protein [Alteromonas antoniana]